VARALLLLVTVLSLGSCATAPPSRPPQPPRSGRSWDVAFPREDDGFELHVGDVRLRFPRLSPVRPIGGVEAGESNVGFGIDLLGIGVSFDDDVRRAREEPVPPEDAEPRALRELGRDLERSIERVHEAAERAREAGPAP
jgi:hypothetical protein